MDAFDISRISTNTQKQHYTSVRMQQGRVILDQDWNENEEITQQDIKKSRIDIIGRYGSPDDGFKIEQLRTDGDLVDFDIHEGTLYLSGLRLKMDLVREEVTKIPETYRTQKDWLQQPVNDSPIPDLAEGEEHFDLVYLHAWQQAVSAIEDSELFEVALGGPDTTTRIRNMRRVHIKSNIGESNCAKAWINFKETLKTDSKGTINEIYELVPDTQLFVDYEEIDNPDDLCSPYVAGGYLGAENQTIRVQLLGNNQLIWGFDNAAPLYKVQVSGNEVTFLTEPKDQHHWPLAGQIVEILPWSSVLANGEKLAEQNGHLSRIETSFNPDLSTISIANTLTPDYGYAWKTRPDSASLQNQTPNEYYYLRVWRGIPDDEVAPINFTSGTPVSLSRTGIQITITGNDQNLGDHWIISARPETPNEVLPWALETVEGTPPHGVKNYFAPLAIIHWQVEGGSVVGKIIRDCRKTFRPLTDLESCCTFHVGDGINSFGDFNSIEEAIENLPLEGGQICVLKGTHSANIQLINRQNIQISGCGETSIIVPHEDRLETPIIRLANVQNIKLDHLNFIHPNRTPIKLIDARDESEPSTKITIKDNKILGARFGIYIRVNDEESGENHILIANNQIAITDNENGANAIFCLADEVLIERNKLVVLPPPNVDNPEDPRKEEPPGGIFDPCPDNPKGILSANFNLGLYTGTIFKFVALAQRIIPINNFQALGGIQIGGGSEEVRIVENTIIGGAGNGITLGHFPVVERIQEDSLREELFLVGRTAKIKGYHYSSDFKSSVKSVLSETFLSFLYNITIENNLIRDMGLSGIGVVSFFDSESKNGGLMVVVENLTVYRNTIRKCAQQLPSKIPTDLQNSIGFGGIALSHCENARIEENLIEDNGQSFVEPICGIFIFNGEDIEIARNRILNNGPRISLTGPNLGLSGQARKGNRGGIYIGMVIKKQFTEVNREELLSDGIPAAKIHDNIVVQPLGQALFLFAFGPVSVMNNQLTSHEIDFNHTPSLLAGAVFILNIGISKDLLRFAVEPSLRRLACAKIREEKNQQVVAAYQRALLILQYLPSGNILFSNNQVVLDLRNIEIDLALSATAIFSFDDIGYLNNQSECKGLAFFNPNAESSSDTPFTLLDYVLFNTFLAAYTVRTNNNRFQEGFTLVPISLFSLGFFNITTGNQASNCIWTFGFQNIETNNIDQMLQPFTPVTEKLCQSQKLEFGIASGIECPKDKPNTSIGEYTFFSNKGLIIAN